jgi:glyoxylase-like metal-dependent hydrolase (beta-lactamase superfamily II)
MQRISKNVFVETGFRGSNNGFVVTSEGIVMIDTPQFPVDAVSWRDEIARHGGVRYLINTEPHGDHYSGDYFFDGVIVSHEGSREAMVNASVDEYLGRIKQMSPESLPLMEGYYFRLSEITLSQRLTIHLGSHTFELINMPGHSPYQVAVHIPEERVVFTSDNIFHDVPAWLHQALPAEWLHSLEMLGRLDVDTMIPGHGEPCTRDYLPQMAQLIKDWVAAVSKAIESGMTMAEAQQKIEFDYRFPLTAEMAAMAPAIQDMNVARLYQVLQEGKD